jgi:GDPmannose 4,6-dehydratase
VSNQKVIITGAAGQDGLILGHKLLQANLEVFGVVRSEEQSNFLAKYNPEINPIVINSSDLSVIEKTLSNFKPDKIFHLSGKSSVAESWSKSEETLQTNIFHTLNWLNALRNLKMQNVRFFHASSSEMFGLPLTSPQTELTTLHPRSPYGVSKVASHHLVINYRESYGQFASTGILFNHESPLRPINFVTRKISKGVADIFEGKASNLTLGNIDISRDWGWAPDYVDGMIAILESKQPDDFILATGITHSLKDFLSEAFAHIGISDWSNYVVVDRDLFRPADVFNVVGNNSKASNLLGWKPKIEFRSIVQKMVDYDLEKLRNQDDDLFWKCD